MKKVLISLVLVALMGTVASAVTVTNAGQVITITTLGEETVANAVPSIIDDVSEYASRAGKSGMIVAHYAYDAFGGVANAVYDLGRDLPDNAVIVQTPYVAVEEAFNTGTDISLKVGSNVVKATGLDSVGVSTGAYPVVASKMSAAQDITVTVGTNAITTGSLTVYIPYILGD